MSFSQHHNHAVLGDRQIPTLGSSRHSGESSNSLFSSSSSGPTLVQQIESTEDKETKLLPKQMEQHELRKEIQKIQGDDRIPSARKAHMIQELMSRKWVTRQKLEQLENGKIDNFLSSEAIDFSVVTDSDHVQTHHGTGALGCKHYQRACKLQAHCCGKWYTCRFCHDDVSDHSISRNLVKTMMCMYCWHTQPAGQKCANIKCGKQLASYYCSICKLWDNDGKKNIYHCNDCGICRIGKGLGIDYFHCEICNVCMAMGLKGNHKCIERNLESDCPICGEYMFTSTSTVIFMVHWVNIAMRPLHASQMPSTIHRNFLPMSNLS